jgi:hypothetical protein
MVEERDEGASDVEPDDDCCERSVNINKHTYTLT